MARSRTRRVPFIAVAAVIVAVTLGACGGGTGPTAILTTTPPASASASALTPDAALLASLAGLGLAADDLAFLASTTFDVTSTTPGTANVVEHFVSGDMASFTVSIAPSTGGSAGLVSATSSTVGDRIEIHLEYLLGTAGMSEEVRQSLEGIASTGRLTADLRPVPLLTAEVSVFGVTVDWAISKAKNTARDDAIKAILEKAAPGKGGMLMRLVKAGFTAEKGAAMGDKLDAQLAELDKLTECAKNPTNPLTVKQYEQEPGARDRILDQIQEARNELIANTIVMQLGVLNGYVAGFGPKWLGYAIGPGTAWSKETLEALNEQRLDEIRKAVTKCDCALVTESRVEPMIWHGQRLDPLDDEWLIEGEATAAGYSETWLYRAVIDPTTKQGTYSYEAIGSIAGGTLTKNGTGVASVAMQPDGSAILTLGGTNVRGQITAGGTTQTVTVEIPETAFTWTLAGTGQCAPPR